MVRTARPTDRPTVVVPSTYMVSSLSSRGSLIGVTVKVAVPLVELAGIVIDDSVVAV